MNRTSIRNAINLAKEKATDAKTESCSSKTIGRTTNNSNTTSSSNSMANISISFLKDSNFPKLFSHSPLLHSFNPQPATTTNSSMRNSLGFSSSGFSSGARTPSCSSYNSLNQALQRDYSRKNSLFTKKPSQLTIDISKKKGQQKQRPKQRMSSIAKQNRPGIANIPECQLSSMSYESAPKLQNIRVFVRIKPSENRDLCVKPYIMRVDDKHLEIDGKIMAYDHVFSTDCMQSEVFERVAKPILSGVFEGFNGTIFAYGQTGSGKTHTIFGGNTNESEGIISRSLKYVFANLTKDHKISLSLLQIYKEELIDLLTQSKSQLKIKETCSGVLVQNLCRVEMKNISDTLYTIESSLKNRRVAATKLNEKSSRSHTVLTIYVESMEIESKLCLIDLAGSEKANKAGVVGENFEEMKKINYSLSCLGNVINALVTRKKSDHIPFRDSKLTRLLKDSLSGRFRTSIIVNCSSDSGSEDETMSSLKFADRAKKVKITISKCQSKGKQNVQYLHKVIQQLTTDLENTKRQLDKYKEACTTQKPDNEKQDEEEIEEGRSMCKNRIQESPEVTARQTIPSERAHLDQQMKKYGKENKLINVVSLCQKQKKKLSINFSQISSLNVSKSTVNIFGEINSPSVSSLSYRPDDAIDDLSFNFSNFQREDPPASEKKL